MLDIDPTARTMVASHTNLQVVRATAREALHAWVGSARATPARRLQLFIEAVHAHDLAARCAGAEVWRRKLGEAIELAASADWLLRQAATDARRHAAKLAR